MNKTHDDQYLQQKYINEKLREAIEYAQRPSAEWFPGEK